MADDTSPPVARILFAGAAVLAFLAVLCWIGALPVAHGAQQVMTLAFGLAAAGDVLIALILLTRSQS